MEFVFLMAFVLFREVFLVVSLTKIVQHSIARSDEDRQHRLFEICFYSILSILCVIVEVIILIVGITQEFMV